MKGRTEDKERTIIYPFESVVDHLVDEVSR